MKSFFRITDPLIQKSHSNTSVHCSYYACLQVFKHILIHKLGKSEASLKAENELKIKKLGSHELVLDTVLENLRLNDKSLYTSLRSWIYDLRNFRVTADYADEPIVEDKGKEAYELAAKIDLNLNNHYYYK